MRIPLEIEAKSTVQEMYAKADQGVKEQEYKRKQELFKTKNASESEVEEARLAVERAKASVEIAVEERAKANAKIKEIQARIALKTLKSPITGFVQAIDTGVGEVGGIDQQKPSFVIVQNDPLKVEADIPIREANRLRVGQTLQVRYTSEDNAPWEPAVILAMLPVADRGAQTRNIVLELPNPQNKPAGLRLDVRLVGGGGAAQVPAANAAGQQ
jgi:multidrug resistance efflux pump